MSTNLRCITSQKNAASACPILVVFSVTVFDWVGNVGDSRDISNGLLAIWRSCDRASWQISYNKPTRCTNFSNSFWKETLHVSDSSSFRRREFCTVHTAMVYVIQVFLTACKQDQDGSRSCLRAVRKTCMTYTIAVCTVQNSWRWTEELLETCRVSFQNKF